MSLRDLDQLILSTHNRLTELEQQLEPIRAELAAYEKARSLLTSPGRRGRGKAISVKWQNLLDNMGNGVTYSQIQEITGVTKRAARAQIFRYVKLGLVVKVSHGVYKRKDSSE